MIKFIYGDSEDAVKPGFLREIRVEDSRRRIDFVIDVDIFIVDSQAVGRVPAAGRDDFNIGVAGDCGVRNFSEVIFIEFGDSGRALKGQFTIGNGAARTYANSSHGSVIEGLNVDRFCRDSGISDLGVDDFLIIGSADIGISDCAARTDCECVIIINGIRAEVFDVPSSAGYVNAGGIIHSVVSES